MDNKIKIIFKKEEREIDLDITNPDLAMLVHAVITEQLEMTKENVDITTKIDNFDTEELLDIFVCAHEEFCDEIEKFYTNIKKEVKTYYDDDELSEVIINKIRQDNQ